MKEKIYKYLLSRENGSTPDELLEEFFSTLGQHPNQMKIVVDSLLKPDSRFVKDGQGVWRVKKSQEKTLSDRLFTIIDFEIIEFDHRRKIPCVTGLLQFKDDKVIQKKFYEFDFQLYSNSFFAEKIKQIKRELKNVEKFELYAGEIYQLFQTSIIISFGLRSSMHFLNSKILGVLGVDLEYDDIPFKLLARKIQQKQKIPNLHELAEFYQLSFPFPYNLNSRLEILSAIVIDYMRMLSNEGINSEEKLRAFLTQSESWVNFSKFTFNKDFIENLPSLPGVYLMKDERGEVFYVGKAKKLKTRISSYFANKQDIDEKGKAILDRIKDISIEVVGSELEALLLEHRYIKEYNPKLNTQIEIHPADHKKYQKERIIIFAPSFSAEHLKLYFINGVNEANSFELSREKPDFNKIENLIDNYFFNSNKIAGEYSPAQIEIIWRWLELNGDAVNYLKINECGNLSHCMEILKNYIRDPNLFTSKIHYQ